MDNIILLSNAAVMIVVFRFNLITHVGHVFVVTCYLLVCVYNAFSCAVKNALQHVRNLDFSTIQWKQWYSRAMDSPLIYNLSCGKSLPEVSCSLQNIFICICISILNLCLLYTRLINASIMDKYYFIVYFCSIRPFKKWSSIIDYWKIQLWSFVCVNL